MQISIKTFEYYFFYLLVRFGEFDNCISLVYIFSCLMARSLSNPWVEKPKKQTNEKKKK